MGLFFVCSFLYNELAADNFAHSQDLAISKKGVHDYDIFYPYGDGLSGHDNYLLDIFFR